MKGKPVFEKVFNRLIRQSDFGRKLLISESLSFIPFVNVFAFGYFGRFSATIRSSGFIVPVLVFTGIYVFALPLYGFAFFLGFLLVISQTNLYFRLYELRK